MLISCATHPSNPTSGFAPRCKRSVFNISLFRDSKRRGTFLELHKEELDRTFFFRVPQEGEVSGLSLGTPPRYELGEHELASHQVASERPLPSPSLKPSLHGDAGRG